MVSSTLPAYLILQLGLSPMQFGAIDGLYQGVGSLVRWIGGIAADKSQRHKELAAAGYGLSALCRLGLLVVGNAWAGVTACVTLDRIGKGFRTAPRDALISLSAHRADFGAAFGVHRALDALGALLGPLVAFGVLALSPRAFDQVFVISFSVALVGLALILLFVENIEAACPGGRRVEPSALLRDASFRRLLLVACLLAVATVSDAFIYVLLQRGAQFGAEIFPLLAAGTAISYVALSIPAGRLADRLGRGGVFIAGHVALLAVYAMLWQGSATTITAVGCVLLLGSYYAMTDGVLAAAASGMLGEDVRGTGLAVLGTGVSLARLLASLLFGYAWSRFGTAAAVATFGVTLMLAIIVAIGQKQRWRATA
jgi:MFS family permease